MNPKRIYILIGETETGKSSIIRALSGVHNQGHRAIMTTNRDILEFRVWTTSSQEFGHTPQDDLNVFNDTDEEFILMSLRYEALNSEFPEAQTYIDAYEGAGHLIEQVVILRNHPELNFGQSEPEIHSILRPRQWPINGNASQIRNWWRWM